MGNQKPLFPEILPPRPSDVPSESEKFGTLRDAAEIIYPGVGGRLYEWWREFNTLYFDGDLPVPGIQFGLTAHGGSFGLYRAGANVITLHKSLVHPSGRAWSLSHLMGPRMAKDVLLHEMVHQHIRAVMGITREDEEDAGTSVHNNPWWVSEIKRLSPRIGLGSVQASVIKQKRVDGKVQWYVPDGHLTMKELSVWPHGLTCDAYYLGETDDRTA